MEGGRKGEEESGVSCQPVSLWTEAELELASGVGKDGSAEEEEETVRVKFPLLGDRPRRGTPERHTTVWASRSAVRALSSTDKPRVALVSKKR